MSISDGLTRIWGRANSPASNKTRNNLHVIARSYLDCTGLMFGIGSFGASLLNSSPIQRTYPSMKRLKPADVVIVGGGWAGLSMAKEVTSRTSLSVLVLDADQRENLLITRPPWTSSILLSGS